MVEQLVDVFSPFDLQVPGQVIKVPKVIIEDIPSRRSCREPHLAEQLAEVPTIHYFFKQTVDIPVPGARVRRRGDLHGFHSGQGSSEPLGAEQNVDIPGPRRGGRRLQARSIEQIVDILVPVEGLQCFRQGQGSASSSSSHSSAGVRDDENEQFHEFFGLFPLEKSAKVTRQVGVGVAADTSSRTPAAYAAHASWCHGGGVLHRRLCGVWMRMDPGLWKLLGTDVFRPEPG